MTLSFGIGAMLLATQFAFAEPNPNCAPRDRVLEQLSNTYGETRRSIGLAPGNGVIEVFASNRTGSWTITVTRPSGLTCMLVSGQSYEPFADLPLVQGQGA